MGASTILVVMGVSGSGKSTIGKPLAQALGWDFEEGDKLHPEANIAKMARGEPLDDADRAPWLAAVRAWIDDEVASGRSGVIACSALKRAYRDQLDRGRPEVRFVYLKGDEFVIAERLKHRTGHFMPPSLLDSQFAALEEPAADERPIVVDIDQSIADQIEQIRRAVGR